MQLLAEVIEFLETSLLDEPNTGIKSGGIVRDGYDSEIDELRNLVNHSHEWLGEYTKNLISHTGITSLKIKYTPAAGYFIETPLSQKDKIPDTFIHKTTLVNAIRFTTPELQSFEGKILTAQDDLFAKEYEVFQNISQRVASHFEPLKSYSQRTASLDYLASLAHIAYENDYVKPIVGEDGILEIEGGRHPVVEKIEKNFISNELFMGKNDITHIITGPNMGGKSTYLRQNALIILMAHMGSFVPATSAKVPLTDKIFSRVGASDNLYEGSSTFMVEMQEVANILHNSTQKSFVIIDEVGRGTSTYDGMSLAWAILQYNHNTIKAKTLFATHYHELVDASKILDGVKNFSVAVGENDENIVFLRKVVPGAMKRSYGIEVARLAGLPEGVLDEARNFLDNFEGMHSHTQLTLGNILPQKEVEIVYKETPSKIDEELKNLDVNTLTPIEALNILSRWKK